MKLNPFSDEISASNLNEGRNMIFFCLMLVAPFYVVVGASFVVDLMGLGPEFTLMTLFMGLAGWVSLTAWHWSNAKSQLNEYKTFDATFHFDKNTTNKLQILFDDSKKYDAGKLPDGRHVYRVGPFTEYFAYESKEEGVMLFNKMDLIMPFVGEPWQKTFAFKDKIQTWFKGLALTTSNGEPITLNVYEHWLPDETEDTWIPCCYVRDSHLQAERAFADMHHLTAKKILYDKEKQEDGTIKEKYIEVEDLNKGPQALQFIQAQLLMINSRNTELQLRNVRLIEARNRLLEDKKQVGEEAELLHDANESVDKVYFKSQLQSKWKAVNWQYFFYGVLALGGFATIIYIFG